MELRYNKTQGWEYREDDSGRLIISGYRIVYNSEYKKSEWEIETIAPGAFDEAIRTRDRILCLYNHDTNIILASTRTGTLILRSDDHGVWFEAYIDPEDLDARNAYIRIKNNLIENCSFGFIPERIERTYDYESDIVIENIVKGDLREISPVRFARYEATSVAARSEGEDDTLKNESMAFRAAEKMKIRKAALIDRLNKITGETSDEQNT